LTLVVLGKKLQTAVSSPDSFNYNHPEDEVVSEAAKKKAEAFQSSTTSRYKDMFVNKESVSPGYKARSLRYEKKGICTV